MRVLALVLVLGGTAAADPPLQNVAQLSVGQGHVCAVTTAGDVVCWGDNSAGQLGVGTDGRAVAGELSRPHVVGGLPKIRRVAAGAAHTCAVSVDGDVWCWGSAGGDVKVTAGGTSGSVELHGDGLGTPVKMPLGAGKASLVALASLGGQDACAVFPGEVRCWRHFQAIPIGARTIAPPALRTTKIDKVTALALGHGKTCAVAGGNLACWRDGIAPQPATSAPSDTVGVALGENYACFASATGEARCWFSLVDDFWKRPPDRAIRWSGKQPTVAIVAGDSPVCTADARGTVDCFLSDEQGLPDQALAKSWASEKLEAHPIAGVDHAIDVGIARGRDVFGYGFGCALRSDGTVVCWGDNEHGMLGSGDKTRHKTAVHVLAP